MTYLMKCFALKKLCNPFVGYNENTTMNKENRNTLSRSLRKSSLKAKVKYVIVV